MDFIEETILNIREHTMHNPELLNAHHFTFDLKIKDKAQSSENYIIIGLNPGESGCYKICDGPTEESSLKDFFVESGLGKTRSSRMWSKHAEYFLGTNGNIIATNFFFWSSRNSKSDFTKKFSYKYHENPHFDFCKDMNIRLFDHYKPKLIVAPGISMSRQMKIKYNLGPMVDQLTNYDPVNKKTMRIVETYDYRGTPFIFTKHWTSRWGANTDEKAKIKKYLVGYL